MKNPPRNTQIDSLSLMLGTPLSVQEIEDQLFPVHDIMHAWPKSLKDPADYEQIAGLFERQAFWKWANPWDVAICIFYSHSFPLSDTFGPRCPPR